MDQDDTVLPGAVFTLTPIGGGTAIPGIELPSGTHTWKDLPTGDYTLTEISVPGGYYTNPDLPKTITVAEGTNGTIKVTNDQIVGTFIVNKKDQNGRPLDDAVFTLTPLGGGNAVEGIENPDGTHTWANLPTGDYTLAETTVPEGYNPDPSLPRIVTVNENNNNTPVTIVNLHKLGNFTVYKKDQDEEILVGAIFTLTPIGGGTAIEGSEDPDGTHTWTNIPTGEYTLSETTVPTGYNGIADRTVTVNEGDNNAAVTAINNRKLGDFTVYKKDQDGAVLPDAVFTLTPIGGDTAIQGTEDPDGTHTWTNLPTGEYTLSETSTPEEYYGIEDRTVTVGEGANEALTITNTHKLGDFTVYKEDQDGATLSGAVFTLTPIGGGTATIGNEDPDGTHTWTNLPTGDYTLSETSVPEYYNGIEDRTVTVNEGANEAITATNNRKLGDFTVYKKDQDEQALADAVFTLTPSGGGTSYIGTGSPSGVHTWTGLPTGNYILAETTVPTGYNADPSLPKQVTVGEGSNASIDVINNIKLGSLIVTKVKTSDHTVRLEGVEFALYKDSISSSNKIGDNKFTNPSGNVSWTDLVPGDYILVEVATLIGYEMPVDNETEFELLPGEIQTLMVENDTTPISITVYKRDKYYGTLVDGAVFNLYNGTLVNGLPQGAPIDTQVSVGGEATFHNLVLGQSYVIEEADAPNYYTLNGDGTDYSEITIDTPGDQESVTFSNSPELGSLIVNKTIDGAPAGTTLDSVSFRLEGPYLDADSLIPIPLPYFSPYNPSPTAQLVNGSARFDDLVYGQYRLYEVASTTVTDSYNVMADYRIVVVGLGVQETTETVDNTTIMGYIEIKKTDADTLFGF